MCQISLTGNISGEAVLSALVRVGKTAAEEALSYLIPAKGNEGINIAFSCNSLIKYNGADRQYNACKKAPEIKEGSKNKDNHTHEL